ncbi:hypothetical protein [Arthrobacter sp. OV608]|uniref:hypothetical protein n=1 Tax=Arthrobacter sp. OV608 TaxID=1882768 RepID=UPI001113C1C7|nr:hypothetical protein [Arthrobacter sp. OV608]
MSIRRLTLFYVWARSEESASALDFFPASFILSPKRGIVPPHIQQVHNLPSGQEEQHRVNPEAKDVLTIVWT